MGTNIMNTQVRAAIYLRQSSDREGTGLAVERQREDCRTLCERNGWEVVRVLCDNNASASSGKVRPEWRELLREVEAGGCDVVVAWAPDRLYRRLDDAADLMERCLRSRVVITTVQAGTDDPTTPAGEFLMTMKAAQARSEARTKGERQRRQQRQAAERGEAPARRAFGYAPGGMELDPAEAPVVRQAFDLLFAGASLVKITAYLNSTGLLSVRGNRWSRKGAAYMLTSPRYAGVRVYRAGQDDEVRTRGGWPTIVSDEEHARAVALLTDPDRKPAGHRGTARRWLGAGLFVCGRCLAEEITDEEGQPVTMRTGRRTTGQRTYICRHDAGLSRAAQPIDAHVLAVIEARLARPDVADLLAGSSSELGDLREQAAAIRRKINRAMADYADELIDAATLCTVKDRHGKGLAVIERKITAAARSSRLATLAANPDPAAAFAAADLSMQREVIDALCTVVLLPTPRGTSSFRRDSVRFDWRA
jgi:site-specific DNA recombinase